MSQTDVEELISQAQKLVSYATSLNARTEVFIAALQRSLVKQKGKQAQALAGMRKFHRRLQQDLKFLHSIMQDTTNLTENKLRSSNLSNFEGMLDLLESERDICGVWQTFVHGDQKAEVDIISGGGLRWFKVKASTRGIEEAIGGMGRFGEKNIFEQLDAYRTLAATKLVQCMVPEVYVYFLHPIPVSVADGIEAMGIRLIMPCDLPLPPVSTLAAPPTPTPHAADTIGLPVCLPRANLDVTAMVAMCSQLTNDGTPVRFPTYKVLDQQALDEASHPVLPLLREFLHGKCVIASRRAVEEFRGILEHVGDETEIARAEALFSEVTIVPDYPADHVIALKSTSRIGDRQKIIFGTGERYRSTTVTANRQFVQAAAEQGVLITHFIHSARALTGKKMSSGMGVTAADFIASTK